jgi:cellulose synthase/poly-beta-1,6-N-acetylglucosamine synthase-like glycosyltransferase
MNDPHIGVLIPAYNEEVVLKGTIDALVAAGCERTDIYVVDDRSTDRTHEVAVECGVNIYTVPENGGKARAQVQALEHFRLLVKYDWLIFLDGDTKVDPQFRVAMQTAVVNDPTVALYVGQVKSVHNDHLFSASRAFDYTFGQDIAKQGQSNFNAVYVSPGCASMYRTDVLAKLHIDPMTLAEDMDLTLQVHNVGERAKYVAEAIVNTQDPSTFKDYVKQNTRWARGFWQVTLKHQIFTPSILFQFKWVHWYMLLLVFDGLVCNKILWMSIVACIDTVWLAWMFLLDVGLTLLIACYCAVRTRRVDVITKLPVYYWLNYVQLYLWVKSFVEIIVLRKEILAWNKVKRYGFSSNSTA